MTGMTRTERYINRAVKAKRQEEKNQKEKGKREKMHVCLSRNVLDREGEKLQLFWGNNKTFPSQPRDVIFVACHGCVPELPPSGICLENLT